MNEENIHSKPRLLITEDDKETQRLLRIFLNKKFDLAICDSATTFYYELDNKEFDLILMDISIRGTKNGLEITKEIRANPSYTNIPIICYTAHAMQKDRINALNAGCDDVLVKPVQNKKLLDTIEIHLSKNKLYN